MAELAATRKPQLAPLVEAFSSSNIEAIELSRPVRLRFGDFELDPKSGELAGAGKTVVLQWQALQLLLMLIDGGGEMVTRDEIRKRIWGDDVVVDFHHSINQLVRKLRRVLGDSADSPNYIETLARRGYRLKVPVAVLEKAPAMANKHLRFPSGKLPARWKGQDAGEPAAPGPGSSFSLPEFAGAAEQRPLPRQSQQCRRRIPRNPDAYDGRLTPLVHTLSAQMLQECVSAATPAERLHALKQVLVLVVQLVDGVPVYAPGAISD